MRRFLVVYGLLWALLGSYGFGHAAAVAWGPTTHPWNGLVAGAGVLLAVAIVAGVLSWVLGIRDEVRGP